MWKWWVTGLGLAIASQLTQLMGGTLTLESRLGAGSRFTLRLSCPSVESPGPLTPHSLVAAQTLAGTTVPPELGGLQELIEHGAVTDILHWADALAQEQPAHAAFAAKVRQAALTVDFAALRGLVCSSGPL